MAKTTTLQKLGLAIVVVSLLGGLIGTVVSIYLSFTALETSEFGGIGPVGDRIMSALVFSAVGILGAVVGVVLLILGRSRT